MRRIIFFLLFSVLAIAAFSQPGTRIKLRQLESAPGSDYYIRSVNDTCAWVMNSEFADSLSVLQDSIIVLYANGSEVSRDTVGPFGGDPQMLSLDGTTLSISDGNGVELDTLFSNIDHGGLLGLTDDDHTQYLLLAGRSGGQVAIGGTATTDGLTLQTTSGVGTTGADMHFLVGNNGATEAMTILNSGYVGLNKNAPSVRMHVYENTNSNEIFRVEGTGSVGNLFQVFGNSAVWWANSLGRMAGTYWQLRRNGGKIYIGNQSDNASSHTVIVGGGSSIATYGDVIFETGRPNVGAGGAKEMARITGIGGDLVVGQTTAGARFNVKGGGATSASVNMLMENSAGTDLLYLDNSGQLGILENIPARNLDVGGEVRIQDLVTDSPTKIVGSDSDGDLGNMYIGAGLTLSGDTLYADGSATTLYYQTIQDDGSDETQRDKLNFGDTGPFHFDVTDDAGNNRTDVLCYPDNNGITYGYIQQVSANKLLGNPTGSTANVSEIAVGDGLQFNGSSIQKINSEFYSYTSATTTTFNIPSGAQEVELICVGGGGGGGSGRKGATTEANTGGGGGGGGSYTRVIYSVSELASTTLDLTIGAGGSGGAGRATNNTNGGAGSAGGDTFVDCDGYTIALAGGGSGGSAGTTAASTGGAGGSVGDFDGLAGTGCATSGSVSSGSAQVKKSAQGGGAGGGIPTGGTPARTGGATGKWNYSTEAALTGGSAGNDGQSCGISYTLDAQHQIGGPGGSGGGSSITGNAGSGGFPCYGGGGGGGGAALNSVGNSGAGGNGGAGFIIIIVRY